MKKCVFFTFIIHYFRREKKRKNSLADEKTVNSARLTSAGVCFIINGEKKVGRGRGKRIIKAPEKELRQPLCAALRLLSSKAVLS